MEGDADHRLQDLAPRGCELNYYRRYVGDYLRDTSRLSMLEHGAYNVLLDHYYAEEEPLPLDLNEIYRIARAILPEERRAVDKVLFKYFDKAEDGYHNARADEEIAKGTSAIEQMSDAGRRGAEKRWGKPKVADAGGDAGEHAGGDRVGHRVADAGGDAGGDRGDDATTNHQPPSSTHQPPSPNQNLFAPSASHSTPPKRVNGASREQDHGESVERIPLNDGTEFEVRKSFVDELDRLFPAVDPVQTLREIRAWNLAKAARRKTKRGIKSHIVTWFAKEQDKHSARSA